MSKEKKDLSGQMWEPCPACGREPVYMSLGGYCEKCGVAHWTPTQSKDTYEEEEENPWKQIAKNVKKILKS